MQEVVGSSPTVSTIPATARKSQNKTKGFFTPSFCFAVYSRRLCRINRAAGRNNVALRRAALTAAVRADEPYCLYHSGDCEKVAKQNEGVYTPSFCFAVRSRRLCRINGSCNRNNVALRLLLRGLLRFTRNEVRGKTEKINKK